MFKASIRPPALSSGLSLLWGSRTFATATAAASSSSSFSFASSCCSSSYEPRSFSDSPAYRGLYKISNVFCNGSRKKLPPEFLSLRAEESSRRTESARRVLKNFRSALSFSNDRTPPLTTTTLTTTTTTSRRVAATSV